MSTAYATTAELRRQRAAARWKGRVTAEHVAGFLLFATLLYGMTGIPSFDRDVVLDTDYVSPLNRWVWLTLLGTALPLLRNRGRALMAVALRSWPLLLLFGYFALTTTWALDPAASVRRLGLTLLQLFLLLLVLTPLRRGAIVQGAIVAACLMVALGDIATWLVMPRFAMTDEGFAGFQLQKNQTGLMMMYGCLAAGTGCLLPQKQRFGRLKWLIALLLMLAILALTRSTTSQAVVLASPVLLAGVWLLSRLSDRVLAAVLISFVTGLGLLVFLYFAASGVLGADPWLPLRGVTFTDRLDLWKFVVGEIQKRPWLGAGYGSFWAINPAIQPSLQRPTWFSVYTIINEGHDGYLDLLAYGGVIGFVGGIAVVFHSITAAFRALQQPATRVHPRGLNLFHMAFLLGLLIHNVTESNLFSNQAILAIALILCVLDLNRASAPASNRQRRSRTKPRNENSDHQHNLGCLPRQGGDDGEGWREDGEHA
jgi:O-antigen ligase